MYRTAAFSIVMILLLVVGSAFAQGGEPPPPPPDGGPPGEPPPRPGSGEPLTIDESYVPVENTYTGIGGVTMGEAEAVGSFNPPLNPDSRERFFESLTGIATDAAGNAWVVPSEVNFEGVTCTDMHNTYTGNGDNPDYLSELQTVVVDEGGAAVTATIFADNYFELYVNGQFICRDSIGFIPFNSSAAAFQASYPITYAVHLLDGETHLGLGMEYDEYNVGDAGFIAAFSDGTVTSEAWKCQPFYIAPLDDPACVVEDENGNRDASACSAKPACSTSNPNTCRALHYEVPADWMMPGFDDSLWTNATLYAANEVTNQAAYVDYAALFADAQFIWTENLDLDNQVVCRLTVDAPPQ